MFEWNLLQQFGLVCNESRVAIRGGKRLNAFQTFNLSDVVLLNHFVKRSFKGSVRLKSGEQGGSRQGHEGSA
jgi:hypothetical protein